MAGMQAFSVVDWPVEPNFLHVDEGEENFAKCPSYACMEIRVSHIRAGIVCRRKTMMMM